MEISVYTDGSYSRKLKKAGFGVFFPNKELPDIAERFTEFPITSQRAELYAICYALYFITSNINFSKIIIYTDSEYSIKSVTEWIHTWMLNDWKGSNGKPVKNLDIIKNIFTYMKKYNGKIFFEHVKSHTKKNDIKSQNNEYVDKLAKFGMMK